MIWYSRSFKNFQQSVVIHTVILLRWLCLPFELLEIYPQFATGWDYTKTVFLCKTLPLFTQILSEFINSKDINRGLSSMIFILNLICF